MLSLSRTPLPPSAEVLLGRLRELATGDSLFSDHSDLIGFLHGHPNSILPGEASENIKKFASLILGAGVTLSCGWSILPPGVASDLSADIPTFEEWETAVGTNKAADWIALAAWCGAEATAQSALPLPFIPSIDAESYLVSSARWKKLCETILARSVCTYSDRARKIGIPSILMRAAEDFSNGAAGGDLWQWNRDTRQDLLKEIAQRDPALVADMFSMDGGLPVGVPDFGPSDQVPKLHASARGVFSLSEWPVPTSILCGAPLFTVREILKKKALSVAPERPQVQSFLIKSGFMNAGAHPHPFAWELAAATRTCPTESASLTQAECSNSAERLFARFSTPNRPPIDYTMFRSWAITQRERIKNIPVLLLETDALLLSEWSETLTSIRRDRIPADTIDLERAFVLESAIAEISSPENSLGIVRAAIQIARENLDGDQVVRLTETLSALLPKEARRDAGTVLLGLLHLVNALSPASVGTLSRSTLVSPHEVIAARLKRRLCGSPQEDGMTTHMLLTHGEEAGLLRVCEDLAAIRGLYFVEHRILSIIEAGTRHGLSPDPALLEIIQKFDSGGTAKGKEKESRALFALISAFDHERREMGGEQSYVISAVKAAANLQTARHTLEVSGQMSLNERTIRLIHEATCAPVESFSRGVATADPAVLAVLHDAHTARACLAGIPSLRRHGSRTILHDAISAFARGIFQNWKYNHAQAHQQIGFLREAHASLWTKDMVWSGEALGVRLLVRESSDFGELLRHADYPVKTCQSLLGFGEKMEAGLAAVVDAHSKLLQFIDPASRRIVGRSVMRLFTFEKDRSPIVVIEVPYTVAKDLPTLAMRMLAARCIGEKFDGAHIIVSVGVCAKDRETDRLHQAERQMGRMSVIKVVTPISLVCDHYVDSNIRAGGTSDEIQADELDMACLLDAVDMVRDSVHITRLPDSLCPKDPPSLFSTASHEDEAYEERCRQVFPDGNMRQEFFGRNPGARLSGTIPGGHAEAWRACIVKFPQLANYLHHSEALQSLIGAPNPDGDGREIRGALAVIEGRPFFRGLIHGMAKDEIAASREQWLKSVEAAMGREPDRWPPEIDYQSIAGEVRASLRIEPAQAFSIEASRLNRGPIEITSPTGGHGFNAHAGF